VIYSKSTKGVLWLERCRSVSVFLKKRKLVNFDS